MKTLTVYASTTGNTKAVAEYIAKKTGGEAMDVKSALMLNTEDIKGYETVILGSRVHAGGIAKEIVAFAQSNKAVLSEMNTAFFICSMFSGEKGDKQVAETASKLGISKGAYFVKGKKLAETGDKIDEFLASL